MLGLLGLVVGARLGRAGMLVVGSPYVIGETTKQTTTIGAPCLA